MRHALGPAALFAWLLPTLACAPPQAPISAASASIRPPSAGAGEPTGRTGASAAPEAQPLAPVPEPSELVGVFHWRNPAAFGRSVFGQPTPEAKDAVQQLLDSLLGDLLRNREVGHQLSALTNLEASVDAVLSLDPNPDSQEPYVGVSLGLASLETARVALAPLGLRETAPSLWRVGGHESPDGHEGVCALSSSVGPAPARLVCALSEAQLWALQPYLTRTLPILPESQQASDLHLELRFPPVDARYGGFLRSVLPSLAPLGAQHVLKLGRPELEETLAEDAVALAEEAGRLAADLDRMSLDLSANPEGLRVKGSILLRGSESWTSRQIHEASKEVAPPPPLFWRLPSSSEWATYSRTGDPTPSADTRELMRALLDLGLGDTRLPADDRRALEQLWPLPLAKATLSVTAGGRFELPPLPPRPTEPSVQQAYDSVLAPTLGWMLVGYGEKSDKLSKHLKAVVAAFNRKGLREAMAQQMSTVGTASKASRSGVSAPTLKFVSAPRALGPKAEALELSMSFQSPKDESPATPSTKKGTKRSDKVVATLYVLLVPDGDATWIGVSAMRDELVQQLLSVKNGESSLQGRAGLENLRGRPVLSSAFVTMEPLSKRAKRAFERMRLLDPEAARDEDLEELISLLSLLPHQGETPILWSTTASERPLLRGEVELELKRGTLDDLGVLLRGAWTKVRQKRQHSSDN